MIAEKSSESNMTSQIPSVLKVIIIVIFLIQIFTISLCGYLFYDSMKIKTELSMYKYSVKPSDSAIDHTSEKRGSESQFNHPRRIRNSTEFTPDVQIKPAVHLAERRKERSIAELCERMSEEASGKGEVGGLSEDKTQELEASAEKSSTGHRTRLQSRRLKKRSYGRRNLEFAPAAAYKMEPSRQADTTFIQWGSFGCNQGEKFLDGYAVAFSKGASTIHCIPSSNLFESGSSSLLTGPRMDTLKFDMQGINNPSLTPFDNELIRCVMCQAELTEIITIIGWSSCNADGNTKWSIVYSGFVMTTETTGLPTTRSEPICMDNNPAETDHKVIDSQAPRLKAVRTGSGLWIEDKLVPCVVCAKANP